MKIYRDLWEDEHLYKDLCEAISNVYKGEDFPSSMPDLSSESLEVDSHEPVSTAAIKVLVKLAENTNDIGILNQIWKIYNKLFDSKFKTPTRYNFSGTNLIPSLDKKIQDEYLKLHREKSVTPMARFSAMVYLTHFSI